MRLEPRFETFQAASLLAFMILRVWLYYAYGAAFIRQLAFLINLFSSGIFDKLQLAWQK